MNSFKLNLKFWLAGFAAGVVLMERWRRSGGSTGVAASSATPAKPKVSTAIVAGAKKDAERARQLLKQVKPSKSETVDPPTPSTVDSAETAISAG